MYNLDYTRKYYMAEKCIGQSRYSFYATIHYKLIPLVHYKLAGPHCPVELS